MADNRDDTSKNGLSDGALWSIGAVALLVPVIALDSIFYFIPDTPFEFHAAWQLSLPQPLLGCVAALVSFAVAYKSERVGFAKALSYIALIALVAYLVSISYGVYFYGKHFRQFFIDPSGHGIIPLALVHHHAHFKTFSYAPPIFAGATLGWLLRRLRG